MKVVDSSINYKIMAFGGAGRSIVDGLQKRNLLLLFIYCNRFIKGIIQLKCCAFEV
jgi:hypothetical protein